ncbi:unnamed protein product [Fraxinus pennsylvanica]|uniref:RNA-dependent RNA polymerase n=1 Tax=Fraxinus pennsylvanica TaxID=56036 RepID=A0AAD2DP95_9LAMI|nr:unnamed protein product [Fraxinus pennsylvanica]
MYLVNSPSSNRARAVPQTTEGQLLYRDEAEERTSPQKSNRQFASEISERTRSLLQILNKLEYRRLFLVLSYIGRQKLETVMTLDDANDILSMKDRSMTNFESKIWDSYGRQFYEKSDRSEDENGFVIFDEDKKPLLHTDGTGYISENLAMQCPKDLCRAKYMKDDDFLVNLFTLSIASNHEGMDEGFMAQRMLSSGIPLYEPYLQQCLSRLVKDDKAKLKTGRIPISESFYVMGTADPTGRLNNDQVCVILNKSLIPNPGSGLESLLGLEPAEPPQFVNTESDDSIDLLSHGTEESSNHPSNYETFGFEFAVEMAVVSVDFGFEVGMGEGEGEGEGEG